MHTVRMKPAAGRRAHHSRSRPATVQEFPHSTELCGGGWYRSSKAPGCQDLDIEEPVVCRYASAFHFHPTLAGMLSSALIRDEVVQVCEPRQKRLLTATGMVKPFHGEQFPLDSVVSLI